MNVRSGAGLMACIKRSGDRWYIFLLSVGGRGFGRLVQSVFTTGSGALGNKSKKLSTGTYLHTLHTASGSHLPTVLHSLSIEPHTK